MAFIQRIFDLRGRRFLTVPGFLFIGFRFGVAEDLRGIEEFERFKSRGFWTFHDVFISVRYPISSTWISRGASELQKTMKSLGKGR